MIYNIIRLQDRNVKCLYGRRKNLKKLTEGNIYKTFILFAIPLVLAGILSQGYNMVDTVIAGKVLGSDGLAATGATAAFITFLSAVFWGYGSGFSIYIARLFGAGDYKEMKNAVCNNLIFVFVAGIIAAVLVIVFQNNILDILKVDAAIREQAALYMVIYVAGLCFIVLSSNCVFVMHALGSATYPFIMSLISAILNVGGNIFTLIVLGWGVAGVAFSTVLSALVVDVFYFFKLRKCFVKLGVGKHRVRIGIKTFKRSFAYAASVMMQQMIMYASSLLISPLVNGIGSAATAAYTVVNRVYDINAGIYQNSAKTLTNYTAQCIGAGKLNTLRRGVRVGLIQGIALLLPVLVLCVVFAEQVCMVFFPSGYSGEAFDFSLVFVRMYMPFIVINLINNLFHAFFRGTASMKLLLIATLIGSVTRLVFSIVFVGRYSMNGIYIGWVLSWIAEAIFAVAVYYMGLWKKSIT